MDTRFSHTLPNYVLAFTLAPFAGAAAAFAVTVAWAPFLLSRGELTPAGYVLVPGLIALYALGICAIYTLAVGAMVVAFVRTTSHIPRKSAAIVTGVLVGFLPFAACAASELRGPNAFEPSLAARVWAASFTPTVALAASLATALSFWTLGLKNRRPVV
jgi:hypothetical protein